MDNEDLKMLLRAALHYIETPGDFSAEDVYNLMGDMAYAAYGEDGDDAEEN